MKQIVDKLNKIAKKIDENVDIPNTDLITDSLDAITTALGGTPNDSNLIVDKLEDIAGVAHGGGGGDSAPFPYVTIHIVNEDAESDLYASYRESGYYLGAFLYSNLDRELDYYLPSVGSYNYEFPDGTILAEKDGGTATIYTLNKLISFYDGQQFVDVDGVFSYINSLNGLTFTDAVNMSVVRQVEYSGSTYNIYGLTDTTKNGEITIKINNGGV